MFLPPFVCPVKRPCPLFPPDAWGRAVRFEFGSFSKDQCVDCILLTNQNLHQRANSNRSAALDEKQLGGDNQDAHFPVLVE